MQRRPGPYTKAFLLGLVLLWAALGAPTAVAQEEGEAELDPLEHVVDAAYMDFAPFGAWELPRIFLMETPGGQWVLEAYGSTAGALHSRAFDLEVAHGEETEVIPATSEAAIEQAIGEHEHLHGALVAREGRIVLDLSITRYLVYTLLAMLLTGLVFIGLARRYRRGVGRTEAPRGAFQNMFEAMIVYIRDEVAKPNLGRHYNKFLPYLLTVFFLILFGNLLGIVPYGEAATANLGVTGVLALFTLVIGHIYASREHWKHLFLGPPKVPGVIRALMVPIEVAGTFTRHAALAIRLFANMVSGGLMIIVIIGLIFMMNQIFGTTTGWATTPVSVLLTVGVMALKTLVAFIQAYVFTLLSALFIGMEIEDHGEAAEAVPEFEKEAYDEHTPAFSGNGTAREAPVGRAEPVAAE